MASPPFAAACSWAKATEQLARSFHASKTAGVEGELIADPRWRVDDESVRGGSLGHDGGGHVILRSESVIVEHHRPRTLAHWRVDVHGVLHAVRCQIHHVGRHGECVGVRRYRRRWWLRRLGLIRDLYRVRIGRRSIVRVSIRPDRPIQRGERCGRLDGRWIGGLWRGGGWLGDRRIGWGWIGDRRLCGCRFVDRWFGCWCVVCGCLGDLDTGRCGFFIGGVAAGAARCEEHGSCDCGGDESMADRCGHSRVIPGG